MAYSKTILSLRTTNCSCLCFDRKWRCHTSCFRDWRRQLSSQASDEHQKFPGGERMFWLASSASPSKFHTGEPWLAACPDRPTMLTRGERSHTEKISQKAVTVNRDGRIPFRWQTHIFHPRICQRSCETQTCRPGTFLVHSPSRAILDWKENWRLASPQPYRETRAVLFFH